MTDTLTENVPTWKQSFNEFFFAERDAISLRVFECLFTGSFLLWIGYRLLTWREWLTDQGFHLTAKEYEFLGLPSPWPLFGSGQVLIFCLLIALGAMSVLWPLKHPTDENKYPYFGTSLARRIGFILLFFCAVYSQRIDFIVTTSANRLFIGIYAILMLAPTMTRCRQTGRFIQSVTPIRVLQVSLILNYFAAGLAKVDGDWLQSADILWSQLQGSYRTDITAWGLRHFPRWLWSMAQHSVLVFEVGAPLLFTFARTRPIAVAFGLVFHLMIAVLMNGLLFFSLPMMALYALFISSESWRKWLSKKDKEPMLSLRDPQAIEMLPEQENFWTRQLGGWQMSLLVRAFGVLLYMTLLGHWQRSSIENFFQGYPASSFYLGLFGLCLMLLGPRTILLVITALAGGDFFLKVLHREAGAGLHQQAAEYPLFVVVPFALSLLAFVLWKSGSKASVNLPLSRWQNFQSDFERHGVLIFRWTVICTLFFVSFHKVNEDFFNPAVTCETVLKGYLAKTWTFSWLKQLGALSTPLMVVLLEGPVCIALLLLWRRVGILSTVAIFGTIGFCDALVITLCIIIPSLAFLTEEDRSLMQRHWKGMAFSWLTLMVLWFPISSVGYQSIRPWYQPAMYQAILLAVVAFVGGAQIIATYEFWSKRNSEKNSPNLLSSLGFGPARMLPQLSLGGGVIAALVLVWLLNGFSPYLGLKFNYSFSMLSNLRADNSRWNHYIVPKWFHLSKHDGYLHVHKAKIKFQRRQDIPRGYARQLRVGLYSPQSFSETVAAIKTAKGKVELAVLLEHNGQFYDYQGTVASAEFEAFVSKLPNANGHWFHDFLPTSGPMHCKH
jgi:hypothetical protein